MKNAGSLAILMATYNGAVYLEEQVRSLQAQTHQEWLLYICDDGSTDGTLVLLASLAREEKRIIVLTDPIKKRGPAGRFGWLLEQTRGRHRLYFFCDQDDVWCPEKLARMAAVFDSAEPQVPMLVHCDLTLVDEKLQEIHPSFFAYAMADPRRNQPHDLAFSNTVTGCACAINQALIDLALPIPQFAVPMMHDWWLAMVASLCGRIVTLPEAMVLYRQHGRNTLGAGAQRLPVRYRISGRGMLSRLGRVASLNRLQISIEYPLARLLSLQKRFGVMEQPVRLLNKGRRRDLLVYLGRYHRPHVAFTTSMLLASDVLRFAPDIRARRQTET